MWVLTPTLPSPLLLLHKGSEGQSRAELGLSIGLLDPGERLGMAADQDLPGPPRY